MGLFFVYVRSFQTIFYRVSVIQTRIDGVEGEHADLLTITTAQDMFFKRDVPSLFLFTFVFSTGNSKFISDGWI